MIRLVQRKLIIPRGDTGSFTIPSVAAASSGDAAIFTIFDCVTRTKIYQKLVEVEGKTITFDFSHGDTVNLPPGRYLWDIKFYKNPVYADGELVDGREIDSYYAGFTLPDCEIRETGDNLLTADDAPTSTLDPTSVNYLTATLNELENVRESAEQSAHDAAESAYEAENFADQAADSASEAESIVNEIKHLTAAATQLPTTAAPTANYNSSTGVLELGIPEGKGIENIELNADYTLTIYFNDNTAIITEPIRGEQGEPFYIVKTYASITQMNADYNGNDVEIGQYVIISSNTQDPDNAKVYRKGNNSYEFVVDLSGSIGMTPELSIGSVSEAPYAAAYITGTEEYPVLNLELPTANVEPKADKVINAIAGNFAALDNEGNLVDSGHSHSDYLTSFTETDPTVPAWAKESEKPSYTPQEVGALPDNTFIPSRTSDLINDSDYPEDANYVHTDNNYTTAEKNKLAGIAAGAEVNVNADWNAVNGDAAILNKPTRVSDFDNDAGYLTTETDPTVPAWAKATQKPTYTAAEVGAPTVAEMNTAIGNAIGNINSFDMAVVQALPTQDISTHTIYLVPKTGETNDVYDEYVYINNNWEMVGNTQIDLSNYVQKTDYASQTTGGVVKIIENGSGGFQIDQGYLLIKSATHENVKNGSIGTLAPLVPGLQHESVFYGLATAAGDTTQSQSNNAVGTYTTEAKAAIQTMLDAPSNADLALKADKTDTVLETTLSRGRKDNTTAGGASLAFGINTEASGYYSVALGLNTTASSQGAYAEGKNTVAHYIAHAEGEDSQALSSWSHAQNLSTIANGSASSASGRHTIANGADSFVFGKYNAADSYDNWPTWTANTSYEVGDRVKRNLMVQNEPTDVGYHCTVANSDATFDNAHWELDGYHMNYVEIVGNGNEYEDPETHQTVRAGSNAYVLEWTGTGRYAGDVYVGCNNDSTGGTKVATVTELATKLDAAEAGLKVVRLI